MHLPLFRVRARLHPKAGLGVELIPSRVDRLAGSTAGQHNEAETIARRSVTVDGQRVTEGGELSG